MIKAGKIEADKQIWSRCTSLHQAPRISCPLDFTVTIYPCGKCFRLLSEPTLLERAPGGSHRGAPISRGAHLSKKLKNDCRTKRKKKVTVDSAISLRAKRVSWVAL